MSRWLDRILAGLAATHARASTHRFLRAAADATRTQSRLLHELIAAGATTHFGREHGLGDVRDFAEFVRRVPIRSYDDFAAYLDRVRSGDSTALLGDGQRPLMFAMTSGTTASPKYIPVTPRVLADCRQGWNVWGLKALLDHPGSMLRCIVQVTSPMRDHDAPSGVPCGAITGLLAATQKRLVRRYYTSPLAVSLIRDAIAKYYTIMRLAVPRDVAWLVTANPATLLRLAETADERREPLIRDIHDGTLDARLPIEPHVRSALADRLTADPGCARRLEQLAQAHGGLFPQHYWRLSFLAHWTGGTMGLYRPLLRRYYGDAPSRDIGLIASEGRMSLPIADETASGLLAVTSQFFEFVPAAEYGSARPVVLRSHEVREGEEYFLILTNASGLFRYDIGDRVRVTGWWGQAPIVEFLSRDATTASMAGEKLTEQQVVLAMQRACRGETSPIINFVVAPRWEGKPWYRLYVDRRQGELRSELARRYDEALSEINLEYASRRKDGRLGGIEVVALPEGALARRDAQLQGARAHTAEQFKHQYLIREPGKDADLASP